VSTIVGSTSEESGFVNVMKILEEERYCMERRLDLITKVLHAFLVLERYVWKFTCLFWSPSSLTGKLCILLCHELSIRIQGYM